MATGNRLSTEIMINLAGNLTAKARQYGANMSQFARNHQKAMNLVKATTEPPRVALIRWVTATTAMIAGLGGSVTVKGVADFDAQMRRMGTNAQIKRRAGQYAEERESGTFPIRRISALMLQPSVKELMPCWEKPVIISMWWTTSATWG